MFSYIFNIRECLSEMVQTKLPQFFGESLVIFN